MKPSAGEGGASLVELLVAVVLIGLALVPLMELYPVVLSGTAGAETDLVLGVVASRKAEEILTRLRADITSVSSGSEPCSDRPQCLLTWTVEVEGSSPSPGVGSLRAVQVTACLDGDGDGTCGAAEPQVGYATKVTSRP
ncbi:MAG: hypothetical protein QN122_11915 [Armatimonadota bacterium]|nr:hypothetical protein [Armatimonadota bacterium]MDR7449945.1 hypothetical protein [Armatimonadota bacterium]MDR7460288.1 hypothetical protein [Armatimonadota bacterium]MDR7480768.1 hypothetical protein [Armatimonadota bacterium]MDR7488938.1 hypothetical protein [Armatimonadota bacterium]